MSLLDPTERSARGLRAQAELLATPATAPQTLLAASWRDYVFAEIWTRPGLDLRSRYLIAMSSAANESDGAAVEQYARGALNGGALTLAELREAALHVAVYSGWSYGGVMDAAITRAADALGLPPAEIAPIRGAPWDPATRHAEGAESFQRNMLFDGPPPQTAYFEGGILNFVFGEMWSRPGLDQRARRWLTLVGVGNSSAHIPIRSHVWSAMASGNATREEMFEFVLHYAVHAGWPRASVMQGAVIEMAKKVEQGLSYDG
ncbi:carboxymuconolactone decarboxylase family protein [Sphingobium sp. H39-3-25]|uniref:carboxymuconolactone decarboxylase family protein n=1 Tax=Sphingobium arseniciresistens TaxID=3030834 RepID=UPI0023B88F79|nr:carboxymuconolactone decarboxylase family protein [Sphingobium arseniciresistens]